ncbi:peroxisomal acyl-coenzyme A oxidase 3-like [Cylas formicarius]|uniref:peroxisomal acyl-coenzyme A oxidase 3-like n=1 Tax=Cylas formicarius TaxID=197179 RepID=UPI00295843F2|nr:peroxisomal acyl-coenzyme A oxidase 3-like [Cylas formicarius]
MIKHVHKMANVLQDFKPGPLDFYRTKASFDWKQLKVFLETEDIICYQNEVFKELQTQSEYQAQDSLFSSSFDQQRRIACRQTFIYKSIELLSLGNLLQNLKKPAVATRIMIQYAPSSTIKFSVTDSLFISVVRSMGTERHHHFIEDSDNGKIIGCYCLTEIGHGSNARGMRTTATYNLDSHSFILNTKDFEAAKCWAGGLGQMATHAIVYANLILDGTNHGLHSFVVPVRDPKTLLPYPGLIVGDMGEKIGLNGVDNGFVIFNNYKIPQENLLNKLGDVTKDGKYVTLFKDPNKRHGASLGALSAGRVNITAICEALGVKALTIAIRYSAVRKQFGPEHESEVPILEYQTHQYRLLPYLAAAYALRILTTMFVEVFYQFSIDSLLGNNVDKLPDLGVEIHALSSATKPIAGWIMKDAIQESRETCGGHGYLKAAGIGDIRNDHDANLTYEGENHVLIQQTSNWLLKFWPAVRAKEKISSPLQSVDFLSSGLDILNTAKFEATNIDEMCNPKYILSVYQWLVCYLLKRTWEKLNTDIDNGKNLFWAKNDSQVFYAKDLSICFVQHYLLQVMYNKILEARDDNIKNVLSKLFALYGVWSLQKHLPTLYQGGYAKGEMATTLVQNSILKLCGDLKNDAVSLIDVIAPPDFILNSVLGSSDGEVYKHLQSAIFRSPYAMSRPVWWQDITNWKENVLKNKL